MNADLHTFVHLLFVGFIALFPVVNPIGSAFIVMPYFAHLDRVEKRRAVRRITIYAFCVCAVALFAGHWILKLLGLSVPVVQLAGGIMICKIGWEFLASDGSAEEDPDDSAPMDKHRHRPIEEQLFYPITFPITTGAGTISVLFTLSAQSADADFTGWMLNMGAILLAIVLMCVLIYVFYLNTRTFVHYLGSQGERIVNRVIAFLIFCVGLQIAVNGITTLVVEAR